MDLGSSEISTADRLLDAAEVLFAKYGYEGVGMRMLAKEAKVNLGAATYHFGSKEALYIETFMRRFRVTSRERLDLLEKAESEAGENPVPVERIVDSMIRPPFNTGLEYPAFHALLARNLFMAPPFIDAAIQREMGPNRERFAAVLQRALPEIDPELLVLRVHFSMGSLLIISAQMERMPLKNAMSREDLLQELVGYISAGLRSPAAAQSPGKYPVPGMVGTGKSHSR